MTKGPPSSYSARPLEPAERPLTPPPKDDGTPLVLWGFAECAATIIAASISMLRPLVARWNPAPVRCDDDAELTFWAGLRAHHPTRNDPGDLRERAAPGRPDPESTSTESSARRDDRSDKSILAKVKEARSEADTPVSEPPEVLHAA